MINTPVSSLSNNQIPQYWSSYDTWRDLMSSLIQNLNLTSVLVIRAITPADFHLLTTFYSYDYSGIQNYKLNDDTLRVFAKYVQGDSYRQNEGVYKYVNAGEIATPKLSFNRAGYTLASLQSTFLLSSTFTKMLTIYETFSNSFDVTSDFVEQLNKFESFTDDLSLSINIDKSTNNPESFTDSIFIYINGRPIVRSTYWARYNTWSDFENGEWSA